MAKRQLATILTIVFLGFLGLSMPYLIFPVLFLNPSYSFLPPDASAALYLGVTLAAYPLGQFLGSPVLGALSDDYGRKSLLASSLVVAAFANLLSAFALGWRHIWLLIFSRFLAGLMEGNLAIARAMAADIKTISRHETFGKINAVASMAYLFGPLLGGLLSDSELNSHFSLATPFYCIFVVNIALAFLSMAVLVERSSDSPHRNLWVRLNILKRLRVLFRNRYLKFLMIVSTLQTLAVDIFYEFGPVFLTTKWLLGPSGLVVYNSVLCLALALGSGWFMRMLTKHFASEAIMVVSTAAMTLLLVAIVYTDGTTAMLLWFILIGFAIALCTTLLTVLISDSVSDAIQGEVMGVQMSLRVLGDAVICLLGGVLLLISPGVILLAAATISAIATLYYQRRKLKFGN